MTLAELEQLLAEPEAERIEFKEARSSFQFDKLVDYCAALANEGGGRVVLGVTDRRPRSVVGTKAFDEPGRTVSGLMERLRVRVTASETPHPKGRVLVFEVAPRPLGMPIEANGRYLARSGDTLRPMTQDELRRIFDELGVDFSAEAAPKASIADLEPAAIELFRVNWHRRSQNPALLSMPPAQLLADAELLTEGNLSRAALILLGSRSALARHLPQAEVVFEYRQSDTSISHQQRIELRQGFLPLLDSLWNTINLRNEVVQYQDGLFRRDLPVFNELAVREAILNAVCHRDYRLPGSIFIRQFPRRLEIVSPGGFPAGITVDNLLKRQSPRNRRIAEACGRCGLVERSGQGIDRIFEESLKEGKARPSFAGTDNHQVAICLWGELQNPQFIRFLERVSAERQISFSVDDLLLLDAISQGTEFDAGAGKERLAQLLETGVIERSGSGRGVRYLLSRKFHSFLGKSGTYTRKRGLDRETNKALLLKHLVSCGDSGSALNELQQVLPALSRSQVQKLLQQLKTEGRAYVSGVRRAGCWFAA